MANGYMGKILFVNLPPENLRKMLLKKRCAANISEVMDLARDPVQHAKTRRRCDGARQYSGFCQRAVNRFTGSHSGALCSRRQIAPDGRLGRC